MAEKITTESPNKFVTIDLHFPLPLSGIDYYDFQLVERDDYELGQEVNVGDNFEDDAFVALPLDKDWTAAQSWDVDSPSTYMRLTFKVPEESRQGYLFYWGEYLGPLEFE